MKLIEKEIVIPTDGKLPPDFREAFGRRARVSVHLREEKRDKAKGTNRLSDFAGKIQTFRDVDDPVALQRSFRDSWKRGRKK